jgi:hypothetical protein
MTSNLSRPISRIGSTRSVSNMDIPQPSFASTDMDSMEAHELDVSVILEKALSVVVIGASGENLFQLFSSHVHRSMPSIVWFR